MAKSVTLVFENGGGDEIGRAAYVVPGSSNVPYPDGSSKPADQVIAGDVVGFCDSYRPVASVSIVNT